MRRIVVFSLFIIWNGGFCTEHLNLRVKRLKSTVDWQEMVVWERWQRRMLVWETSVRRSVTPTAVVMEYIPHSTIARTETCCGWCTTNGQNTYPQMEQMYSRCPPWVWVGAQPCGLCPSLDPLLANTRPQWQALGRDPSLRLSSLISPTDVDLCSPDMSLA